MSKVQYGSVLRYIRKLVDPSTDADLLQRFVEMQDESAFETLVRRHGPLVRAVCLRALGNADDADDAFQATFLVLARNAGSVRRRQSVGAWLHEVARRIARKARLSACKRRRYEQQAADLRPGEAVEDMTVRELGQALDEELARLPEIYRAPLLLCCMEGKTRDEAAQELGWSVGSVKGRLERGRELLRSRLARRGLTISASLFSVFLAQNTLSAALPPALAATTAGAAARFAAGLALAGTGPTQAVALAHVCLRGMFLAQLKLPALFLLLALGLAGTGAGTFSYWTSAENLPESSEPRQVVTVPVTGLDDAEVPISVDGPDDALEMEPTAPLLPPPESKVAPAPKPAEVKTDDTCRPAAKTAEKPAADEPAKLRSQHIRASMSVIVTKDRSIGIIVTDKNGERKVIRTIKPR